VGDVVVGVNGETLKGLPYESLVGKLVSSHSPLTIRFARKKIPAVVEGKGGEMGGTGERVEDQGVDTEDEEYYDEGTVTADEDEGENEGENEGEGEDEDGDKMEDVELSPDARLADGQGVTQQQEDPDTDTENDAARIREKEAEGEYDDDYDDYSDDGSDEGGGVLGWFGLG
jgi:hypothetical protein